MTDILIIQKVGPDVKNFHSQRVVANCTPILCKWKGIFVTDICVNMSVQNLLNCSGSQSDLPLQYSLGRPLIITHYNWMPSKRWWPAGIS